MAKRKELPVRTKKLLVYGSGIIWTILFIIFDIDLAKYSPPAYTGNPFIMYPFFFMSFVTLIIVTKYGYDLPKKKRKPIPKKVRKILVILPYVFSIIVFISLFFMIPISNFFNKTTDELGVYYFTGFVLSLIGLQYFPYKFGEGTMFDEKNDFKHCQKYDLNYSKKELIKLLKSNLLQKHYTLIKNIKFNDGDTLYIFANHNYKDKIFLTLYEFHKINKNMAEKIKERLEQENFEGLDDVECTINLLCTDEISDEFKRMVARSYYDSFEPNMNVGIAFKDNKIYIMEEIRTRHENSSCLEYLKNEFFDILNNSKDK